MKRLIICAIGISFATSYVAASEFTTFNMQGVGNLFPSDISGNTVVGWYMDSQLFLRYHGFVYDGTTCSTLDMPGASSTQINSVSGSTLVGTYQDSSHYEHGFVYDGTTWTTIDVSGQQTVIRGIDNDNLVGYSGGSGFVYNMNTQIWTILNAPDAISTRISGISGSNIVGYYLDDSRHQHGFVFDGTNWTVLDPPGASVTSICGISGQNIVGLSPWGSFSNFVYNMNTKTFTPIEVPGLSSITVYGIDGTNIIGAYADKFNKTSGGFVYTIPEPATLLLLGLGGVLLRKRKS